MVICILGVPGVGKSTLVSSLRKSLYGFSFHPGRFAREKGLVATPFPSRAELLRVPQLADGFLEAVAEIVPFTTVLLDGFPRSQEQAVKLVETGWNLVVVHLKFPPGQEIECSVSRQEQRLEQAGVSIARSHLEEQATLALNYDLAAIEELSARGIPVVEIDALQPAADVELQVLRSPLIQP